MKKRKAGKKMKPWRGWICITLRSGNPHYYDAVKEKYGDAMADHLRAKDGSGKFTRLARVEVRELPTRRDRKGKRKA